MTGQLSLLDMPVSALPVRSSDPATSVAAARALPVRERQREVLDALRLLSVSSTADDVRQVLAERGLLRDRNEVASRLSELADVERWPEGPLVAKVGVRQGRRGRAVATWRLTEQGRRA